MYVVREGYEGLVRGNTEYVESSGAVTPPRNPEEHSPTSAAAKINLLQNLRFGDGELLKDGTSEYQGGRTLKGRYIVRVGWDDVRGWFSEVRSVPPFPAVSPLSRRLLGWNTHRYCKVCGFQDARGKESCCSQPHPRGYRWTRRLRR